MTELSFERPFLLLLAVPLVALVLRRAIAGPRGRTATVLRALAVALALGAAAGPVLDGPRTRPQELLVAVQGASSAWPRGKGVESQVLVSMNEDPASAIAGALAMRSPGTDARLMFMTDGTGQGTDAAIDALRVAASMGVPVFVRPMTPAPSPASPRRSGLAGVFLPRAPAPGVPFRPRWRWTEDASDRAGWTVSVRLNGEDRGSAPASEEPAELRLAPGVHILEVEVRDGDGGERGALRLPFVVPGPPSVVLVDRPNGSMTLAAALKAQGLDVEVRRPRDPLPAGAVSLVILGPGANTAGLGAAADAIERRVREGTGLLVLGGVDEERSVGRLRDSGVEPALPVFLPPPPPPTPPPPPLDPPPVTPPPGDDPGVKVDEGVRPGARITLLLLVDTSGSMHGLKLEMARRAAAAAAATVGKDDRFGLITFTERASWRVPLMPAGNARDIAEALGGLRAEGNTDLLPALEAARMAMARETTAVRHCIVFSDGETSPFGLRRVVDAMVDGGVTLSTIGVGAEFDVRLLGNLAQWGHGRAYPAVDPRRLPQVVTLDTRRVMDASEATKDAEPAPDLPPPDTDVKDPDPDAGDTVAPDPVTPAPVAVVPLDPSALLAELGPWPAAIPPQSLPDPRLATTVALGFEGDRGPVLVLGRHGLGRTAVLVPGADGGLGDDPASWHRWRGWGVAMARLARGLSPVPPASPVEVMDTLPTQDGTAVSLEIRAPGETVLEEPEVRLLEAGGDRPRSLTVSRLGDARFRVLLPYGGRGPRTLAVTSGDETSAVSVFDPGPPAKVVDPGAVKSLADRARATLVTGTLPPPPPPRPGPPRRTPLHWWLAAAALVLFLLDTGVRRMGPQGPSIP